MKTKSIVKKESDVATVPDAKVAPVGVVGEAPVGFEALRRALSAVNAHTDTSEASMRADVATVTAAMIASRGDGAPGVKNRGRWTGLRTYDFQNTLFAVNERSGWRFTDRTLAVAWAAELASNRCDFIAHADYVGSTRTAYTRGRHGSNVIDPTHRTSTVFTAPKPRAARTPKPAAGEPVAEPVADVTADA